jgi:oligopeptide/dipeptide ABC transporter ATP-binding protein
MGLRSNFMQAGESEGPTPDPAPLLRVEQLTKHFPIRQGLFRRQVGAIEALHGVSFAIYAGETLTIVGDARSGKSALGRAILQLEPPTAGRVFLREREVTGLGRGQLRQVRREMGILFQDPYTSLSPHMRVREIVEEPLRIHQLAAGREQVADLLTAVALNPYFADRLPFEFSGGQRQRINIARVLASNPALVILDEPLAVLDPVVRPQIRTLLQELKAARGLSYIWLTRDLGAVLPVSDRIGVLYLGRLVEIAAAGEVERRPLHPFTQYLRSAMPLADGNKERVRQKIELHGQPPDPQKPPSGCHFHPRCAYATDLCKREQPLLREVGRAGSPHQVACHHAEQFWD